MGKTAKWSCIVGKGKSAIMARVPRGSIPTFYTAGISNTGYYSFAYLGKIEASLTALRQNLLIINQES